jgi:hypothetical protein
LQVGCFGWGEHIDRSNIAILLEELVQERIIAICFGTPTAHHRGIASWWLQWLKTDLLSLALSELSLAILQF